MDTLRQAFREQAARFYDWLRGREAALQQQREQTIPNGTIRQAYDADSMQQQQRRQVEQERQRHQEQRRGR